MITFDKVLGMLLKLVLRNICCFEAVRGIHIQKMDREIDHKTWTGTNWAGDRSHIKIDERFLDRNMGRREMDENNWTAMGLTRVEIGRTNWTVFRLPMKHPGTCDTRMCCEFKRLIYFLLFGHRARRQTLVRL